MAGSSGGGGAGGGGWCYKHPAPMMESVTDHDRMHCLLKDSKQPCAPAGRAPAPSTAPAPQLLSQKLRIVVLFVVIVMRIPRAVPCRFWPSAPRPGAWFASCDDWIWW